MDNDLRGQSTNVQNFVENNYRALDPTRFEFQVPDPVGDFIGRATELEKVLADLKGSDHGAVIYGVRGMGGVGKTELAFKAVETIVDEELFPDGQIYFNLRGASDDRTPASPVEILSHVIQTYHPDQKLPDDVDQLIGICHSVLKGKRVLLLMDNALNAEQLRPLERLPRGCALLVTSREHIVLSGMETIDVNEMAPTEARDLLIEICPRIGADADELAELCGYLPLALRLAASALKKRETMQVNDYLSALTDEKNRLKKLGEHADGMLPVDSSLELSYATLDDDQQAFFRTLGVFPADFHSEAANSVCPIPQGKNAEALLGDLHAASMILWEEDDDRYRLHDLVRDFARGKLDADESTEAERNHAMHYCDVLAAANQLCLEGGEAILIGLALYDRESHNITAGHAWATNHRNDDSAAAQLTSQYAGAGPYCLDLRLHARERITWLDAAVEAARIIQDRKAEGNHLGNLGMAYDDLGETQKAFEFYEHRLKIAWEIGDRRGEGNVLGNMGNAYANLGEIQKAIKFFEHRLEVAREIGDQQGEGNALNNLGVAYANLGETQKAIELYKRSLAIFREIGDRRGEGNALGNMGNAYDDLGETQKAMEFWEHRIEAAWEIGDRHGEGNALRNVGVAYANLRETQKAIEFFEESLVIFREIGDRRGEGDALNDLGVAYANLGKAQKAIEFFEQQLEITGEIGNLLDEGRGCFNLAREFAKADRVAEALPYAERALAIFEPTESTDLADKARSLLERLRTQQG
jgi:tetratricopeptide (TPR) repeat protein